MHTTHLGICFDKYDIDTKKKNVDSYVCLYSMVASIPFLNHALKKDESGLLLFFFSVLCDLKKKIIE